MKRRENRVSEDRNSRRMRKRLRIKIRIGNELFETFAATLERFPETLLGCHDKRTRFYDLQSDTFVFSEHVRAFDAILYYYQSYGSLIRPPFVSLQDFENDCRYFEIDEKTILRMKKRDGFLGLDILNNRCDEVLRNQKSLRRRIWCFLEYPETSLAARLFACFSFLLIAFSVLFACLITLPSIQINQNDLFHDPYFLTELGLNVYFLVEYTCRFFTAPRIFQFLTTPLCIIDFVAVIPYFVVLSINAKQVQNLAFLKIMRTLRVLRLFRLTKHSKTFQTVMLIMSQCVKDIFMLFICFFIACIISASMQYYVELTVPGSMFTSIPQSMWWSIQTLVCLGYGDMIPLSIMGKITASAVAIFGAITLSVPLLSVGGKYLTLYAQKFCVPIGEDMDVKESKTEPAIPRKLTELSVVDDYEVM